LTPLRSPLSPPMAGYREVASLGVCAPMLHRDLTFFLCFVMILIEVLVKAKTC